MVRLSPGGGLLRVCHAGTGQGQGHQNIAHDGAATVGDQGCRIVADGGRDQYREPGGTGGRVNSAVGPVQRQAKQGRDQQQDRPTPDRQPGQGAGRGGGSEYPIDIRRGRHQIRPRQGNCEPRERQHQNGQNHPLTLHQGGRADPGDQGPCHRPIRLPGESYCGQHDADRRQGVAGSGEADDEYGQSDQSRLQGHAPDGDPAACARGLATQSGGQQKRQADCDGHYPDKRTFQRIPPGERQDDHEPGNQGGCVHR